jgi:energy-coupling factor transporter transmembrane protein EcfT
MDGQVAVLKLIVAYTLVAAFVFTVIMTCLSLVGWVKFAVAGQQRKLFASLIVELVVICLGVFTNLLNLNVSQTVTKVRAPVVAELEAQERSTSQALDKAQSAVLAGLTPETDAKARQLLANTQVLGIELRIIEGYRSPAQQAALYAQGRTSPGKIVTNTKVSAHNTGMAFDVVVVKDGKVNFDNELYKKVGALGRELGLVWGGDWTAFKDMTHFELPGAEAVVQAIRDAAP